MLGYVSDSTSQNRDNLTHEAIEVSADSDGVVFFSFDGSSTVLALESFSWGRVRAN